VTYIPPETEHTVVAQESLMLSSQININFKLPVTTDRCKLLRMYKTWYVCQICHKMV